MVGQSISERSEVADSFLRVRDPFCIMTGNRLCFGSQCRLFCNPTLLLGYTATHVSLLHKLKCVLCFALSLPCKECFRKKDPKGSLKVFRFPSLTDSTRFEAELSASV